MHNSRVPIRILLAAVVFCATFASLRRESGVFAPFAEGTRAASFGPAPERLAVSGTGLDNDWFMAQRSYPLPDVPRRAAERMRASMRSRFLSKDRDPRPSAGGSWDLVGPTNIGGRVMAVLIHPADPDIIYAGAASGGVWKSTDFGVTWTNVFNESFSIGALAFDPLDPSTIYVGTGENSLAGVATYPGNGIWRSTDDGATWASLGLADIGYTGKIIVNPLNPQTIYVAATGLYRAKTAERGIYKSTNGGASWTQSLYLNDTTGAIDAVFDPLDTNRVIAAMWTRYRTPQRSTLSGPTTGLYETTDGGASWSPIVDGFPSNLSTLGRISLSFAPSDPATIYALAASGVAWGGIYKSTDIGASWTMTFDGSPYGEGQVWYNNIVTVHPTNPNFVWAGMTGLYTSTNGGTSFGGAAIGGPYHPDHHALAYAPSDPSRLVLGNDGGVFTSTDGGVNWLKSYNLPITQFYAGTVSAQNSNRILGGTQDNNSMQTSNANPDTWTLMYCCDGFYCLIDPVDSNYVYAEYQNGGLAYSTNGGASFSSGLSGLSGGDRWNWETPIAMDLQHPKTIYTGSHRMYRTTNNMQLWTPISGDLTYGNGGRVGTISTIDVSPTDSAVIYVGTDDGRVWVTTNGGGAWTDVASTLPLRWVTRVSVDPESSRIAYVTLSGFIQNDYAGHVYRTTDFGASWTNIGGGLPDIPVNDLVVDPGNRSTLYIATDLNVMASTNLGATWSVLGSGFPEVPVHDLAIHAGDRRLVAFTHGRSAYRYELPEPGSIVVDIALGKLWNLVSNPAVTVTDSASTLFPDALTPAYRFIPGGSYSAEATMVNGAGYWLKFSSVPGQHAFIGGSPLAAETVAVSAGWNLVGSVSEPVSVLSIASDPPGLVTSEFFGYAGSYAPSDTIEPGSGYWVKLQGAGSLLISSVPAALPSALIQVRPTAEQPPAPPIGPSTTAELPSGYALGEAYPNPFNPSTRIGYSLPEASQVRIAVYDLLGREVALLVDGIESAGERSREWNADGMASGVYLCRIEARGLGEGGATFAATRKLLLMR